MQKHMGFIKNFLKVCFVAACIIFTINILDLFKLEDKDPYQAWNTFYNEPDDSIDALFFGASNVFPFWNGPYSFHEYGHVIYSLSTSSVPAKSYKYMIEEARKTQPNAKIIICLNTFKNTDNVAPSDVHHALTYMKLSKTKVDAVNALAEDLGISGFEKLEYYFPFIRFHSRWNELNSGDFNLKNNGVKNAITKNYALTRITDVTQNYKVVDATYPLSDSQTEVLNELLDYLEQENIDALFVLVPQAITSEVVLARFNTMKQIVQEKGYDVIDLIDKYSDIGLQLNTDFYNNNHINIHGSLKFTHYLGDYFNKYYQFEDKRSDENYKSWHEAYDKYTEIIKPHTLDFERDNSLRDYSLVAPTVKYLPQNDGIEILWDQIEGAKKYSIYRRSKIDSVFQDWEFLSTVDSNQLKYLDENITKEIEYFYTVVPSYQKDGNTYYGNFNYVGNNVTWYMRAPKLLSIEKEGLGAKLEWEKLKDADGYYVYRRINGQKLEKIATVTNKTSYIDYLYMEDLPYLYTASAYYYDDDGNVREGIRDRVGLLFNQDNVTAPELELINDNNQFSLKWEEKLGFNSYRVYIHRDGEGLELLKKDIKIDTNEYKLNDDTLYDDASYCISAVISYNGENLEFFSNEVSVKDMEGN